MAEDLSRDLHESEYRRIRLTTLHCLSKWCHPKRPGSDVVRQKQIARRISELLFEYLVARKLHWSGHCDGAVRHHQTAEWVAGIVAALAIFWLVRSC